MGTLLIFAFLFFCGSLVGWIMEVIFCKFFASTNPEHKWINPGFLMGPYVPIYGFGLCALYLLANIEPLIPIDSLFLRKSVLFIVMALFITLLEYVAGLFLLKFMNTRLWDYSEYKFNFQGIICPLFTFFWWALSAFYYFLIHNSILESLVWLSENLAFSFFIGLFFGIFIIDTVVSFNLVYKIRKFAKENDIIVKYDQLKQDIRQHNIKRREKASFLFSFKSKKPISDHLNDYLTKKNQEKSN